jgi:hypothetical protein
MWGNEHALHAPVTAPPKADPPAAAPITAPIEPIRGAAPTGTAPGSWLSGSRVGSIVPILGKHVVPILGSIDKGADGWRCTGKLAEVLLPAAEGGTPGTTLFEDMERCMPWEREVCPSGAPRLNAPGIVPILGI